MIDNFKSHIQPHRGVSTFIKATKMSIKSLSTPKCLSTSKSFHFWPQSKIDLEENLLEHLLFEAFDFEGSQLDKGRIPSQPKVLCLMRRSKMLMVLMAYLVYIVQLCFEYGNLQN